MGDGVGEEVENRPAEVGELEVGDGVKAYCAEEIGDEVGDWLEGNRKASSS